MAQHSQILGCLLLLICSASALSPNKVKVRSEVRLDFTIEGSDYCNSHSCSIRLGLFDKHLPTTVNNFLGFMRGLDLTSHCKKLHNERRRTLNYLHGYKHTTLHEVKASAFIKGGDVEREGGKGGCSMYGKFFDDEKLDIEFSQPYLIAMDNDGHNLNNSKWIITMKEAPEWNGRYVVFGKVLGGKPFIKYLANEFEGNPTDVKVIETALENEEIYLEYLHEDL